jgi:membrane dipeptidase
MNRRQWLGTVAGFAAAAGGAPAVLRGRYRLFAGSTGTYSARALDLVGRSLVIDMLSPLLLDFSKHRRWMAAPDRIPPAELERYRSSGIDVFHIAVGTGGLEAQGDTLKFIAGWNGFIAQLGDRFMRIGNPADLARVKGSGKVGLLLGVQNSEHFRTVDDVDLFHGLGQRVSQLTYNARNLIGNGSTERRDDGLSDYGLAVVSRMNQVGMAVDVSHSGDRTTLDAIEASTRPVLITHSNCRALVPGHPRCKTDEAIRKMAAAGGVMGITGVRMFVRAEEPTTIEHVLDHFDHVARLTSVEHVGLGSDMDLDGYDDLPAEDQARLRAGYKESYRFREKIDIEGLDHPKRVFDLIEGLIRRGYSDSAIEQILGKNFERALTAIWRPAPRLPVEAVSRGGIKSPEARAHPARKASFTSYGKEGVMRFGRMGLLAAVVAALAIVSQAEAQKDKQKKLSPKDLEKLEAQGDKLMNEGKPLEAGGYYLKITQEDPTNGEAALKLARVYAGAEEWENAIGAFKKAAANLEGAPQTEAYAGLAGAAVRRSKWEDAAEAARKALAADASIASAQVNLAYSLMKLDQMDEALSVAQKAIELSPTSAVAHATLGEAMLTKGNPAEAETAFRKAIELDAKTAEAYSGLAEIQFRQQNWDAAIASAEKALELNTSLTRAYAIRGKANNAKGNSDAAYSDLAMAITVNPNDAEAHLAYAQVHRKQGNRDMAAASYRKALELDANLKGAYLELGEILVAKGDHSAAVEILQKATAAMPDSAKAWELMGKAQEEQKQVDEALASFTRATDLDPNMAESHYWKGKLLLEQKKDVANALPALEKAVALDGSNPDYLTVLGGALFNAKQLDRAIELLKKAASTPDYRNPVGYYYLGAAYLNTQAFADAVEPLQKVVELTPNWGQAHVVLGWAYFGMIKKGCPCGPEDEERVQKMKEHYEKAVSLGTADPALQQRVEILGRGEKIR